MCKMEYEGMLWYSVQSQTLVACFCRRERGKGKSYKYLIKWRDRPYEYATWEAEDDLPRGMQDWQQHIDAYWRRRREHESGGAADSKRRGERKPKKRDVSGFADMQSIFHIRQHG